MGVYLLSPLPVMAVSPAQQIYLQAEQQSDPYQAAKLWKQLLDSKDVSGLGKGITRETVQLNLVQSLLKAGSDKAHVNALQEALGVTDSITDVNTRVWALMAVARESQGLNRPDIASEARERTAKFLNQLPDARTKSGAAYGMVATLMRGGPEFEKDARRWLPLITVGRQHALALQLIATASTEEKDAEVLYKTAKDALRDDDYKKALHYALALPLEPKDRRQVLLLSIYEGAKDDDQFLLALDAISGMEPDDTQTEPMLEWVEDLTEDGEQEKALQVATLIAEPGDAARAWGTLAKYYNEQDEQTRLRFAWDQMQASLDLLTDGARKADIAAENAKVYAETGSSERAQAALKVGEDSPKAAKSRASVIKALTDSGKLDAAKNELEILKEAEGAEEFLPKPVGELARAYAKKGMVDEAQDVLDDYDDVEGDAIDKARQEIIRQLAKQKKNSEAEDLLPLIQNSATRREARAMLYVAEPRDGKVENSVAGITLLLSEAAGDEREVATLMRYGLELGMVQEAEARYATLTLPAARARLAKALARYYIMQGNTTEAVALLNAMPDGALRDKVLGYTAELLAQRHHVSEATKLSRYIVDFRHRVKTYRRVAEIQARYTDFYGIIAGKGKPRTLAVDAHNTMPDPADLPFDKPTPQQVKAFEQRIAEMQKERSTTMLMTKMMPSAVGRYIPQPVRLSRLEVDEGYVRGKMPAARTPFQYHIMDYRLSPYNEKFVDTLGSAGFETAQDTVSANVIYIHSGAVSMPALYDRLKADGHGEYLVKKGKTYTLRAPIVIGVKASFAVEGPSVEALRMSTERRSYIVNAGELFIVGTRVLGWSEEKEALQTAKYKEKYSFRPYITSWSRSHTYMAGSEFVALGYSGSKSYGISLTSGPKQLVKSQIDEAARPRAVITDNSFRNLLYGFYSYEADHVVLVGNEYVKNIVYGIDPHDRSRWFTIAYNTAYDTEEKHGIIISREVNFSTILGNISFDNIGSGIMIDRQSSGTLIYANSAYTNKQDGLTIFESSCKIIASNRFFDNGSSGIRVRNSTDVGVFYNVLKDNKSAGIFGYTADLTKDPAHAHRDFALDPFSDVVAFNAVGNWVEKNGAGVNAANVAGMTLRANQFVDQSPKLLRGEWTRDIPDLLTRYDMKNDGIFLTRRCPTAVIKRKEPCSFRASGYFRGDGQSNLIDRILHSSCEAPAAAGGA